MKVFVSSVISNFEPFREAAVAAVTSLGHQVIRAEAFPAAPGSPQQVCLEGVRRADVVVLIVGGRYGYEQASGLSATHEEYREARERKPILIFVQTDIDREPEQDAFLREVQSWSGGHFTANFATPDELRNVVTRALHEYELSSAAGPVDESEMLVRADRLIPNGHGYRGQGGLCLVVVGGPRQQVLRPAAMEEKKLRDTILQRALFGPDALFDKAQGSSHRIEDQALILEQERGASIQIDELGSLCLAIPPRDSSEHRALPVLVEEEVRAKIEGELRFADWLLDEVDGPHRLSEVVISLALIGSGFLGWQTRAEYEASQGGRSMGVRLGQGGDRIVVHPSPPRRKRAALLHDTTRLAEDLTILLRREVCA